MNKWIIIKYFQNSMKHVGRLPSYDEMKLGNVSAFFLRDGRFKNDQIFTANKTDLYIVDGVILNLTELKATYQCKSLFELINKRQSSAETFFESFIGPFDGCTYNLENDQLMAFGNQTGDSPVFYYYDNDYLIVSNDTLLIVDELKQAGVHLSFNEKAARYIMTFGYMIDDSTLVSEVHRLLPGNYLLCSGNRVTIYNYFKFENTDESLSVQEAINEIDHSFRKAVQRCFDKDLEYGYKRHLADMSGGLDSRMVNWVARELGYKDIVNISYSQSGSYEYKCAREVSYQLKNIFIHEQLDDARFIMDADEILGMEYGLAPYYAVTGGNSILRTIDFNEYGLEHTGQLGDVILGAFTQHDMPINTPYKRYSYLLDVDIDNAVLEKYNNLEDFLINTRGFLGMLSTHLIRRHYTYAVSPFLDIEFLKVCMRIPLNLKRGQKIYWDWVDNKYPEAGRLKSTRERPIGKVATMRKRLTGKVARETKKLLFRAGMSKSMVNTNNMNPVQYWWDTDQEIREFVEKYYQEHIHLLNKYLLTQDSVKTMIESVNATDKLLAITVLAAAELYFGETKNGESFR